AGAVSGEPGAVREAGAGLRARRDRQVDVLTQRADGPGRVELHVRSQGARIGDVDALRGTGIARLLVRDVVEGHVRVVVADRDRPGREVVPSVARGAREGAENAEAGEPSEQSDQQKAQ